MKFKIAILSMLIVLVAVGQQIAPNPVQLYGQNNPDPGKCGDTVNLASTYTQAEDPTNGYSGQYVCLQQGPSKFQWVALAYLPPGTTGTTGTVLISNGKTLTVFNSLRLVGTDNATTYLPTTTGGVPLLTFCGPTSGSATCANTASGNTARVIGGTATLASNSAVISGITPAFTSASPATFACIGQDLTTRANPVQVATTSTTSVTITNTTGSSDVIQWQCIGY